MSVIISLNNISKSYTRGSTQTRVLNSLNLDINRGEFISIMGPSGSGKSTLLNLIAGLDKPDCGEVRVSGERIDALSAGKLANWRSENIGFIFQFYNLMHTLSAEGNVELPLLLTRLNSAQRKNNVGIALTIVGLAERAKNKPSQLSGGQLQRVAIARAIVSDPTILICDEPTGDLDRDTADEILELLKVLNEDHGKTIVMVTHDPKAANYASRKIKVDKGNLIS